MMGRYRPPIGIIDPIEPWGKFTDIGEIYAFSCVPFEYGNYLVRVHDPETGMKTYYPYKNNDEECWTWDGVRWHKGKTAAMSS